MTDTDSDWSKWLARIKEREKVFEDGWWKTAKKAQDMYDGSEDTPFNVLYANTEILLPALYSNSPRPDIQARSPQARPELPKILDAFLTSVVDCNTPGLESFDEAMEGAVLSALVPGAAAVRIRAYPSQLMPIRLEAVGHNELLWGKAKKWSKVPWIAFRIPMSKEDIVSTFSLDEEQARNLSAPSQQDLDSARSKKEKEGFYVYELWVKKDRQVVFLCEGLEDPLLDSPGDTLQLAGFYPTPGILTLVRKDGDLCPTPLFEYYRNQAEELNRVTVRLTKVLSAIKVRGAYNSLVGTDLARILSDDDSENALIPSSNPMDLQAGFDKQIWLLPIEKLIVVATQLYEARERTKRVIYEITGLADIVRGASVASETATAQNLKDKWGSLRLRRLQKTVKLYVRDLFRLSVDAGTTLPTSDWKALTGLPYPTQEEKALAQQGVAHAQQMAQVTGFPPGPEVAQMAQTLASPSWEDLLSSLKDDAARSYLVDVESDSTLDSSAQTDKQEVSEFVMALSQLVGALAPLAQMGEGGIAVARDILLAVANKFRFGRELKDTLEKIPANPTNQPNNEEEKKALDKAKKDIESGKAQLEQQQKQLEQATSQAKSEFQGQEQTLKDLLGKIKEADSNLKIRQSEFAAEVKIAGVEAQAQDAVRSAQEATTLAKISVAETKSVEGAKSRTAQLGAQESKVATAAKAHQERAAMQAPPPAPPPQDLKPVVELLAKVVQSLPEMVAAATKSPGGKKTITKTGEGKFTLESEKDDD